MEPAPLPTLLFGGALSCDLPPPAARWFDVSRTRPAVPDNQEVFVLDDSDASLIVEILERADVADDGALAFLFDDLAEQAGAAPGAVVDAPASGVDAPRCPEAAYVACLSGVQRSPPPRGAVRVTLGLVRLAQHSADVLVSLSAGLEGGCPLAGAEAARTAMTALLKSFSVVNAGLLFADPGGD